MAAPQVLRSWHCAPTLGPRQSKHHLPCSLELHAGLQRAVLEMRLAHKPEPRAARRSQLSPYRKAQAGDSSTAGRADPMRRKETVILVYNPILYLGKEGAEGYGNQSEQKAICHHLQKLSRSALVEGFPRSLLQSHRTHSLGSGGGAEPCRCGVGDGSG